MRSGPNSRKPPRINLPCFALSAVSARGFAWSVMLFARGLAPRFLAGNRQQHFLLAFDFLAALLAGSAGGGGARAALGLRLHRAAQRIHEVDHLAGRLEFRRFDLYALGLFLDQVAHRVLVVVLEFLRLEVTLFGFDNVAGGGPPCLSSLCVW